MTSPIYTGGAADPGGLDGVTGDTAAAVDAAAARRRELASDTYGQGSVIGDVMDLPGVVSDTSKRTGGSDAREYRCAGTA